MTTRPPMPLWVKVFAVLTILVAVLFVHRLLSPGGGGQHGHTPPASSAP